MDNSGVLKHRGKVCLSSDFSGSIERFTRDELWYANCEVPPLVAAENCLDDVPSSRYFFSRATATTLDADDESDGIFARWADFGDWQVFNLSGHRIPHTSSLKEVMSWAAR